MTSVRRIAKQVGVSVATVSRALNDHPDVSSETRRRVLEAASKSGYVQSVGRRLGNSIGVVYPNDPVEAELGAFESAMLSGILRGINERRFDLTLINAERDKGEEETYAQFFYRKGVRGAIVRALDATPRLAEWIAAEGFPCVLVADRSSDPHVNFVASSSRPTTKQAIDYLIQLGHRRIGLAVHSGLDSDHLDRVGGYHDAIEAHGLEPDTTLEVSAAASPEGGRVMLERLLSIEDPPTAIYFTDPLSTVGALNRCLQLGVRVPRELSIIGFDDADVRMRTFPSFSAVCQDAHQMGLEAARWLTRRVDEDRTEGCRLEHRTRFAIHESTGPAPASRVRLGGSGQLIRSS